MFIDITDNMKQINEAAGSSFWGHMSASAQLKTGFSVAGGVVGFIYAISGQRQNVMAYVIGGLIMGAMVGWTSDFVMKKFTEDEVPTEKNSVVAEKVQKRQEAAAAQ